MIAVWDWIWRKIEVIFAADDKIRVLIEIYQRCVSKDVNVLEIWKVADKCLLLSRKLLVMLEIYQRFVLNLRQSC